MERQIPRPGEKYIHFKKKPYQIICVADHSETREKMVVYQALYGDFSCYVRPLKMFLSEVDHEKYPEVQQRYRFELADEIKQDAPADPTRKSLEVKRHQMNVIDLDKEPEGAEEQADPALLRFLEADTLEEKLNTLITLGDQMTDRLIDNIAVTLDVVIPEGKVDIRYQQLLASVRTMLRYETNRLR